MFERPNVFNSPTRMCWITRLIAFGHKNRRTGCCERSTTATATKTVAGGISVAAPVRGAQVIAALKATGGSAVAVLDEDIINMQRLLASGEGVFAEPTSAAAFAGLELPVRDGAIERDDLAVVAVTGFGLKDKLPE